MAKTKITMFLDPDLIEWLDQNRDEETSRSAYLRILIRKDMKTKSRRKNAPVTTKTDLFANPVILETMIPDDLKDQSSEYRLKLIEKAVEEDDLIMESYLDGKEPSIEELKSCIRKGTLSFNFDVILDSIFTFIKSTLVDTEILFKVFTSLLSFVIKNIF